MSKATTAASRIAKAFDSAMINCAGLMDDDLEQCWDAAVGAHMYAKMASKSPHLFADEFENYTRILSRLVSRAVEDVTSPRYDAHVAVEFKGPMFHRQSIVARRWDALYEVLRDQQRACDALLVAACEMVASQH